MAQVSNMMQALALGAPTDRSEADDVLYSARNLDYLGAAY